MMTAACRVEGEIANYNTVVIEVVLLTYYERTKMRQNITTVIQYINNSKAETEKET